MPYCTTCSGRAQNSVENAEQAQPERLPLQPIVEPLINIQTLKSYFGKANQPVFLIGSKE